MSLYIKKIPSKNTFRLFSYAIYHGDELITECTNLHTANRLMMQELNKDKSC